LNLVGGFLDNQTILETQLIDSLKTNNEEYKLLLGNLKTKFNLTTPNSIIQLAHFSLLKVWQPIIKYFDVISRENTLPKGFQIMHERCLQIINLMISLLICGHKKDKILHFVHFYNYMADAAESWLAVLIDKKMAGTAVAGTVVPCNPANNNNKESWKGDSISHKRKLNDEKFIKINNHKSIKHTLISDDI
jgi:hypothetical protein